MSCPYLSGRLLVYEHFLADCLDGRELAWFLSRGWRKFGHYFFRPACPDCRACIPLRIAVDRFRPSRSQRRAAQKCRDIETRFGPLRYDEDVFSLYAAHSSTRFGKSADFEEFAANLHSPSCPTLMSRYELGERLLGAGYLVQSIDALSSVYFVFDPAFSALSLGVFSVLHEVEEARQCGLSYYYLGYLVRECSRMTYKARFAPHQLYSWADRRWREPGHADQSPYPGTIHLFSG